MGLAFFKRIAFLIFIPCVTFGAELSGFTHDAPAIKIRTWFHLAMTDYNSTSDLAIGNTAFQTTSYGFGLEVETIPAEQGHYYKLSDNLKYLADFEMINSGTVAGRPVNYFNAGFNLTWWPIGAPPRYTVVFTSNKEIRKADFLVFLGPTFQRFTELRSNTLTSQFLELTNPELLGIKLGARACIPVSKWSCVQISAHSILPITIVGDGGNSSLNFIGSVSFGGSLLWDYAFLNFASIGVGYLVAINQIKYASQPNVWERVRIVNHSPVMSLQLRF